jgi:hypothetical protein
MHLHSIDAQVVVLHDLLCEEVHKRGCDAKRQRVACPALEYVYCASTLRGGLIMRRCIPKGPVIRSHRKERSGF